MKDNVSVWIEWARNYIKSTYNIVLRPSIVKCQPKKGSFVLIWISHFVASTHHIISRWIQLHADRNIFILWTDCSRCENWLIYFNLKIDCFAFFKTSLYKVYFFLVLRISITSVSTLIFFKIFICAARAA